MRILIKNFSLKLIYLLTFVLCHQGCASDVKEVYRPAYETIASFEMEQKIDELLLLIQKRLVIMHEVARTKWNQGLPIEDKAREQQILLDLASRANQYGLDEKFVMQFFQAQIEASKEIQRNDFLLWEKSGISKFDKTFSLKDELRLYIDRINNEMILLLSKVYTNSHELSSYILDDPISKRKSDSIDKDIWLLAILPLKNN